jgi:hypothetical protein
MTLLMKSGEVHLRFNKVTYREHSLSGAPDSAVYYLWRNYGPFVDNPVLNKHAQPSCCINTTSWLIFLQAQTENDVLEDCHCCIRILTAVISATWYSRMNKFNQELFRVYTVHSSPRRYIFHTCDKNLKSISLIFSFPVVPCMIHFFLFKYSSVSFLGVLLSVTVKGTLLS